MLTKSSVASTVLIGAFFLFATITSANADTMYNWSYSDSVNSGSGTLTTGALDADQTLFPGGYDITHITGTWDGHTIIGLGAFDFADNILYPGGCSVSCTDDELLLDTSGLSFVFFINNTPVSEVIRDGGGYVSWDGHTDGLGGTTALTITEVTPIPAALPLFATGLGALGLLGWRRKRKALTA